MGGSRVSWPGRTCPLGDLSEKGGRILGGLPSEQTLGSGLQGGHPGSWGLAHGEHCRTSYMLEVITPSSGLPLEQVTRSWVQEYLPP